MLTRRDFFKAGSIASACFAFAGGGCLVKYRKIVRRPNILWILGEDASPHIGCYGETAIETPNLDKLAAEGVRFENAFVTCPVCSPSRSALVTGIYQTTLGAHNHRSQSDSGKSKASREYYDSFRLPGPVPMISDIFRRAGYYTTNGAYSGKGRYGAGKTDYNFINTAAPYDGTDWRECPEGKPFFAQIQLKGGKSRGDKSRDNVNDFRLPRYYPDDEVMRDDWITYLNSWRKQDRQVGDIVKKLNEAGKLDETVIFFLTDHGISHIRGKQFVYDEGVRVPLIVRFGDGRVARAVRDDLVIQIDLAPTSLGLAGIDIPKHFQGRDIFAKGTSRREFIVCGRDRCDETIDVIRCVRSKRYKYIRNFMSYRPHAQANQYKDGKQIVKTMKKLHEKGKLDELQSRIFKPTRPREELYEIGSDPLEIDNLAADPKYAKQLEEMRRVLYDWMVETKDVGLICEPMLEDLGKKHGSKYHILLDKQYAGLVRKLIETIEAGEKKDLKTLRKILEAGSEFEKYWAATWLGVNKDEQSKPALEEMTRSETGALRIAALLGLHKTSPKDEYLEKLADEINNPNVIVGMYAMNAIEQTGVLNETTKKAAEIALESDYNFTKRYGVRLKSKFK